MIAAAALPPPSLALLQPPSFGSQGSHVASPAFNNIPDVAHLATQQASKIQEPTEPIPNQVDSFYTRGITQQVVQQSLIPVSPDASTLSASLNTNSLSEEMAYFQKKRKSKGGLSSAELLEMQAEMTELTIEYGFYGQLASKAASSIQTLFNNQV